MSDQDDRWRIKEFAIIVGVQEATLRAWERRYDLLAPERTPGGFRLYSRADERRIRSMQAHMARGIAPAQAASLAVSESAVETVAPARPDELIEAVIAAAVVFDATRVDALLDSAFAHGHVAGIRDVILPVLVEIGLRWERAEITIGHEHFASHLIERRLLTLARGWDTGDGPLALLACPSGERHTLGLVCIGLVLADRGWRIAYLGADTPLAEVVDAGASMIPAAVVLSSLDRQHLAGNAELIADLGRHHPTFIAGAGATADLARRLGVHHADGDPTIAVQSLAGARRGTTDASGAPS